MAGILANSLPTTAIPEFALKFGCFEGLSTKKWFPKWTDCLKVRGTFLEARNVPYQGANAMKLSPGKLAGLKAVANKRGVIAALAMDQRGSLQSSIAKEKGIPKEQVTHQLMSEFKTCVTKVLSPYATAVLLDPTFGLEAVRARAKGCGALLAYEETGYEQNEPGRIPRLIHDWTVRRSKEQGANAIKILLYYTPFDDERINARKHAWVERIGQECAAQDLPYFLEFVGYDPKGGDEKGPEYAKLKPEIVTKSMEEFSKPQYAVDVLKVEVPVNMTCVEGTKSFKGSKVYTKQQAFDHFKRAAAAAKRPFIYLSAGVDDDVFRETLELANEAKVPYNGVLCGRATWKAGIPVYAKEGRESFEGWLADRGVKNIQAMNAILERGARSWESHSD